MLKPQFIKDISEKEKVRSAFLVKFSAVAVDKSGRPYMNLVLMDRSGEMEGRIWDDVPRMAGMAVRDAFVLIEGKCQSYQGRRQIVVKDLSVVREDEVNIDDFLLEKELNSKLLYDKLVEYVRSMEDPFYKALAESVLIDDEDVIERLHRAPAAKSVHHAYPAGLLEHIVSITGILDSLALHYSPSLDRDLLFLGGFFHDIGKLWELSYERVTDYTDEGRLIGHLVMGVELMTKKIQELEAEAGRLPAKFPEDKKLLVKHLILSHHGRLEYGSPKRPKFLEAIVVHAVDDLDSKMGGLKEFMMADQTPGKWTQVHRQYNRYFLKPDWAFE